MLTDRQLSAAGIKAEFQQAFDATPTIYQDICTRLVSTTEKESYRWLGSVPAMREWGTGRKSVGMVTQAYDITNQRFEATCEWDRSEEADDQVGGIRLRIGELAQRAAQHKDSECARLLINGHSSGYNAYDGLPFFSASHVSGKSGTQSNAITSIAANINAPTTAEARTALAAAISQLLSLKDDQGEPYSNDATGLICITPPQTYLTFLEALSATIIASTSNVLANAARVIGFARLSTASVFYLLKSNVAIRPLVFQDREPIEFRTLREDSETGFMREKFLAGVRARYAITFGEWARAVKVTLSTS